MKDENMSAPDKKATVLDFDKVLGLGFENLKKEIIPEKILKLAEQRESARKNKDFKYAWLPQKSYNSFFVIIHIRAKKYEKCIAKKEITA